MSNNIQVGIKVRPLLRKERESKQSSCWKIVENTIQLADSQTDPYCFDHIFNQDASNQIIFEKMAKHIVHSTIQGINGTIFAYGQTSSGKTYTMMGDEKNPGVMVLAAKEIFKEIDNNSDRQFLLRVGYIEIYNEKIYDLLNKKNTDLKIHETGVGIVSVNCEEFIILSENDLLNYLCMGSKERTVGETNMNERSSRSHAIFRIIIESRKMDRSIDDSVNQSVLNLVDLAGSERADQTGARGTRLKEGGHINKSLLFLSNVIKMLSENPDGDKYISYRDSKLTRILQASLGGNALTSVICTIKPTAVEETQSTLSFAMRAKSIKNKPEVNEIVSDSAMMKRLEREINTLRTELAEERCKNINQLKVCQLEDRLRTQLVKILTSSVNKKSKEKRRFTWCPGESSLQVPHVEIDNSPTPNTNFPYDESEYRAGTPDFPLPTDLTSSAVTFTRLVQPQVGVMLSSLKEELPTQSSFVEPAIDEDVNKDAICPFGGNSTQNITDSPKSINKLMTISITPKLSVSTKLKLVENDLEELMEYTNLEKNLDIKFDKEEAMKARLNEVQKRNAELECEHLEFVALRADHIALKQSLIDCQADHDATKRSLDDCQKSSDSLEVQVSKLMNLHESAVTEIAYYKNQLNAQNDKIKQLEMENREAVSLDFEFQRHKNKSKLRESELLEALAEKDKEIIKLERSLSNINEEKLHNSKDELLQLSCGAADSENGQICVKCEDLMRLLEENKKIMVDFDKLTLEYERLQLNHSQAVSVANETQSKLAALEQAHCFDVTECDKLRNEIASIRGELEQVQAKYAATNCDNHVKTEALNREINVKRAEILELQDKYTELECRWKQEEDTLKNIKTEYDAIQLKYQCLQAKYQELEHTSNSTAAECARLQVENECLQTDINDLKQRVEQAQQQLQAGSTNIAELDKLKQQNITLQAQQAEVQQQYEEMEKEYDVLSNQLMDQLQDGEMLKAHNNKLEAQLALYKQQEADQASAFATTKDQLMQQVKELKIELEQMMALSGGKQVQTSCSSERSDSLAQLSMRSSGLGLDDYVTPSPTLPSEADVHKQLAQFAKLAEKLIAIELEYAAGQSRRFIACSTNKSQETNTSNHCLVIQNIQEILCDNVEDDDDDAEDVANSTISNDFNYEANMQQRLHMQGSFLRHSFKIVSTCKSESLESLSRYVCSDFEPTHINTEIERLNAENKQLLGTLEMLKKRAEDLSKNNDFLNAEKQTLVQSTERTINEMREEMSKLAAELFEKSLFVEKCACQDYQKQIQCLERERAEMTILCEELQAQKSDTTVTSMNRSREMRENESDNNLERNQESNADQVMEKSDQGSVNSCQDNKSIHQDKESDDHVETSLLEKCEHDKPVEELLENTLEDLLEKTLEGQDHETKQRAESTATLGQYVCDMRLSLSPVNSENVNETHQENAVNDTAQAKNIFELKNEINKLSKEIVALQTTVVELNEQLISEREKFNCKAKQIAEFKKQIEILQIQSQELINAKETEIAIKEREFKEEYNRLQLEYMEKLEHNETLVRENLRKYNRDWEEGKENYERTIVELKDRLDKYNAEKTACKRCDNLIEVETEKQRLLEQIESMQTDLSRLNRIEIEFEDTKQAKKEIEAHLTKTLNNWHEIHKVLPLKIEEANQLQKRLNELLEEKEISESENEKVKKKLHIFEEIFKTLEQNYAELKVEKVKLEEKIKSLETERDAAVNEAKSSESERDAALREAKSIKLDRDDAVSNAKLLKQELETETDTKKQLQVQIQSIREQLIEAKNSYQEQLKQLQKLEDDNKNVRNVLEETNISLANKTEQTKVMELRLTKLLTEHDELLEQKLNFERQQICDKDALQCAQQKLSETKQKVRETSLKLQEAELRLRNKNSSSCSQCETLAKVEKEKQSLHEKLQRVEETLIQSQEDLQQRSTELEEVNSKIKVLSKAAELTKTTTLKKIETLLEEKQELKLHNNSLQSEKLKLLNDYQTLQRDHDTLQHKLSNCIEEKQQLEFAIPKLEREKQAAEQLLKELDKSGNQLEQQLKNQIQKMHYFEMRALEYEQLQISIKELKQQHEAAVQQLKLENEQLQQTLSNYKEQLSAAEGKRETLQLKIQTLTTDLDETQSRADNYNKLLLEHNELAEKHILAIAEQAKCSARMLEMQLQMKTNNAQAQAALESSSMKASYQAELEQTLLSAQAAAAKESAYNAELEEKLLTAQAAVAAANEEKEELCKRLSQNSEQLGGERSALVRGLKDMHSNFSELQLKFTSLKDCNNRLMKTNANLEQQLRRTEEKIVNCAAVSKQLQELQTEKQTLREELERHKELLEQQVDAYNKLRTLLNTKESTFKDEKQKLEGTISCVIAEKKTLEERLYATEVALKKFDEQTSLQKNLLDSPNNLNDANTSFSPRNRKSFERLMGENNQLKTMNLNLEDKLMSMQQKKGTQIDSAERRSRRMSTHDEHRRQSLWGSLRDATTMTDPADSTCNCIELDVKLKECQRSLFIRESQVTALNMEIKNHPLKSENIMLKKKLQDEQEKSRNEIKKYKQIIIEQKTRPANALIKKEVVEKPAETIKPTVSSGTQTDSDIESIFRKLDSKYSDLKNICRHRNLHIKELESQLALLSKEKENSSSNVPLSSLEEGQIKAMKNQCERLKKELNMYKQRFEDAKLVLSSRSAEIQGLRAKLGQDTN